MTDARESAKRRGAPPPPRPSPIKGEGVPGAVAHSVPSPLVGEGQGGGRGSPSARWYSTVLRYAAQAAAWLVFAATVGYFSAAPAYRHFDEGRALIKLAFTHGGDRETACRQRSREELMKLPPNMRKQVDCPRRRVALRLEVDVDGKALFAASLPPTGLSGDGPSHIYRRIDVAAGRHVLDLRLRDSRRQEGFDHVRSIALDLAAGESVAIDFRPRGGGFVVR